MFGRSGYQTDTPHEILYFYSSCCRMARGYQMARVTQFRGYVRRFVWLSCVVSTVLRGSNQRMCLKGRERPVIDKATQISGQDRARGWINGGQKPRNYESRNGKRKEEGRIDCVIKSRLLGFEPISITFRSTISLIAMFVLVVESLCSQHFFSNHTAGGTHLNRNKIILNEGGEGLSGFGNFSGRFVQN
jgi:hypothetical protein